MLPEEIVQIQQFGQKVSMAMIAVITYTEKMEELEI